MVQNKSVTPPAVKPGRYMFLVLGMHRSGTSALTGLLHHVGCRLPKQVMGTSEANPQGYFEGKAFYEFNVKLLRSAGTTWNDWRPIKPSWLASPLGKAQLSEARDVLVEEFGHSPLVVLKDPRICRMVPFWTEAAALADYKVLPILTHRNPLEVAKSLQERDGIEIAEGMLIWLRHVLDAEHATRGAPRVVTSYDQLLINWPAQLTKVQNTFDITFPHFDDTMNQIIEEFLSPQLRHHTDPPEKVIDNVTLSYWIRDTYEILERWTVKKEAKADYAVLDRVRAEFDAATPVFSQLLGPKSRLARSLEDRAAQDKAIQHAELQNSIDDKNDTIAALKIDLNALNGRLSETQSALAQRRAEADETLQRAQKAEGAQHYTDIQLQALNHIVQDIKGTKAASQSEPMSWGDALATLQIEFNTLHQTAKKQKCEIEAIEVKLRDGEANRAKLAAASAQKDAVFIAKLEEEKQQNDQVLEQLSALQNSTFWKLTKPLRTLVDIVRIRRQS